MNLTNILAIIETMGKIENIVQLDWLGNIIKSLIEGCGSIGLGIIVFTLILKLITLPFDIFSRISTKKSAVMMEKIRPELERLQRQYSNNKELYQRKMADLYKKNGYSPFSACLPTVLNLVFFIVVIGQFSTYSHYANFSVFCNMSAAYEQAVLNYDEVNNTNFIISATTTEKVPDLDEEGNEKKDESGNVIMKDVEVTKNYLDITEFLKSENNIATTFKGLGFEVVENEKYNATAKFGAETNEKLKFVYDQMALGEKGCFKGAYQVGEDGDMINIDGVYNFTEKFNKKYQSAQGGVEGAKDNLATAILDEYSKLFVHDVIKEAGREAAAKVYRDTDLSFLWVKNIWSQDLPWQHPVKETFKEYGFVKSSGCCASCNGDNMIDSVSEEQYKELTGGLSKEKSQPNGYLILVILSIGTMLLSQIVMQKQNKTQMELSSVDGENGTTAMTQKMMTWMMPVMFGVFSFMYTASFSIYIVISSVVSLLSTLIINKLVEKRFERLAKREVEKEELKRTGRITEIKEKGKNKKKK